MLTGGQVPRESLLWALQRGSNERRKERDFKLQATHPQRRYAWPRRATWPADGEPP